MKKFFLLLLIVIFIPCLAHAQLQVIDALLNTVMEASFVSQTIHYVQMVKDNVESLANMITQIEQMAYLIQTTVQNLESIQDIDSWDDFKDWYNRQLYYESMMASTFNSMSVKIGNKDYSLSDLKGMRDGFKESYVDYWKNEFTEDQRRDMWLGLGLTPANYAYVQPIRQLAKDATDRLIMIGQIGNEKYMSQMTKNNKRMQKLALDAALATENKMGQKAIQMMQAETAIDTNIVLNDILMTLSDIAAAMGTDRMLQDTPNDTQAVSLWWKAADGTDENESEKGFLPIK